MLVLGAGQQAQRQSATVATAEGGKQPRTRREDGVGKCQWAGRCHGRLGAKQRQRKRKRADAGSEKCKQEEKAEQQRGAVGMGGQHARRRGSAVVGPRSREAALLPAAAGCWLLAAFCSAGTRAHSLLVLDLLVTIPVHCSAAAAPMPAHASPCQPMPAHASPCLPMPAGSAR